MEQENKVTFSSAADRVCFLKGSNEIAEADLSQLDTTYGAEWKTSNLNQSVSWVACRLGRTFASPSTSIRRKAAPLV